MSRTVDEIFRGRAFVRIQQPDIAKWLSEKVINTLDNIKNYDTIPSDIQRRIAETCAEFYGAGYIHGMEDHWQ